MMDTRDIRLLKELERMMFVCCRTRGVTQQDFVERLLMYGDKNMNGNVESRWVKDIKMTDAAEIAAKNIMNRWKPMRAFGAVNEAVNVSLLILAKESGWPSVGSTDRALAILGLKVEDK